MEIMEVKQPCMNVEFFYTDQKEGKRWPKSKKGASNLLHET